MMAAVRALSGDVELLDKVSAQPFTARVHSVFGHAVNLQDGAGMFTLVTAATDNAPSQLVVATHSFVGSSLSTGVQVTVADSTLSVGRLAVDVRQARRWQPVLPEWVARPDLIQEFARLLDAEGTAGSLRTGRGPVNEVEAQSAFLLTRTRQAFESTLAAEDLDTAYWQGTRLVGLGGGLTPAGDDYLLGMFAALASPGAGCPSSLQVLRRIVANNADRTNDISRAALIQASRGRVRESIIELVRSLVGADRSALPSRVRRLLAIGHTSGTDIATGLLAGLRLRLHSTRPDRSASLRR